MLPPILSSIKGVHHGRLMKAERQDKQAAISCKRGVSFAIPRRMSSNVNVHQLERSRRPERHTLEGMANAEVTGEAESPGLIADGPNMDSRTWAAAESWAVARPGLAAGLVGAAVAGASACGRLLLLPPATRPGRMLPARPCCPSLTKDPALHTGEPCEPIH